MKNSIAAVIICFGLSTGVAIASADIPLTWHSVHIQTSDRGGAELRASAAEMGDLELLELTIKGNKIYIPEHCLDGLVRPYLNGIKLNYGQFMSGRSYWSVVIPCPNWHPI